MAVKLSAYVPTVLYSPQFFSVSDTYFCKRLSEPQGLVRLEELRKFKKNSITSSGLEPAAFQLVT
jgi:hypothetical protein